MPAAVIAYDRELPEIPDCDGVTKANVAGPRSIQRVSPDRTQTPEVLGIATCCGSSATSWNPKASV